MRTNQQTAELKYDQRRLDQRPSEVTTDSLSVVIPYTTPELSLTALRHVETCADLNPRVSLVDVQVVPFSCPMEVPPIGKEFSEGRLQTLFARTRLPGTTVVVYTRDRLEGYRIVLKPASLVIVATRKRWWPTKEERLARSLQKAGHRVMLLPVR